MGEWGSVHNFFACRACRAGGAVPGCLEIRQHALKKAGPLAVGVHRWDGCKSGRADVFLFRSFSPYLYISLSLSLSQPFSLSHLLKRRAVGPSDRRPSAPIGHGRVVEAPPHILTFSGGDWPFILRRKFPPFRSRKNGDGRRRRDERRNDGTSPKALCPNFFCQKNTISLKSKKMYNPLLNPNWLIPSFPLSFCPSPHDLNYQLFQIESLRFKKLRTCVLKVWEDTGLCF
jgi:hypothetical protein